MFTNIGKKIKTLAKVFCWVGIISSVVGGISMISRGIDLGKYYGGTAMITGGIIILVAGSVVAWISSFVLYGFGELVDKTCDIERNTQKQAPLNSAPAPQLQQQPNQPFTGSSVAPRTISCPVCGKTNTIHNGTNAFCYNCGEQLSAVQK